MTAPAQVIDDTSTRNLDELIDDELTGIDAIGAHLDGLDHHFVLCRQA